MKTFRIVVRVYNELSVPPWMDRVIQVKAETPQEAWAKIQARYKNSKPTIIDCEELEI